MGLGKRIAVYCSDVAGAFDRVCSRRLLAKLSDRGVHEDLLRLLASWLQARRANVCVDGSLSDPFVLGDMISGDCARATLVECLLC